MKKLLFVLLSIGFVLNVSAQDYPDITQNYRYLAYFSPALAGMNDNLDINVGFNFQPSGLDNNLNTSFFSAYYSTGANHYSRNSIRGTQSVDDYYRRRGSASLKMGFGASVFSESVGRLTTTYNSQTYAVHVPVADHTYVSLGVAAGFNMTALDVDRLTVEDLDDPVYQAYLADGDATALHLDVGLAANSDEFYIALGLNNLASTYLSGYEDETRNRLTIHAVGGYRVYHSNDIEAILVGSVSSQEGTEASWSAGVRARYRQILMAGFNYTGDGAFITQLGLQVSDYLNVGYSFSYKAASTVVVNSTHEVGIGIRLMNHNKYVPIW